MDGSAVPALQELTVDTNIAVTLDMRRFPGWEEDPDRGREPMLRVHTDTCSCTGAAWSLDSNPRLSTSIDCVLETPEVFGLTAAVSSQSFQAISTDDGDVLSGSQCPFGSSDSECYCSEVLLQHLYWPRGQPVAMDTAERTLVCEESMSFESPVDSATTTVNDTSSMDNLQVDVSAPAWISLSGFLDDDQPTPFLSTHQRSVSDMFLPTMTSTPVQGCLDPTDELPTETFSDWMSSTLDKTLSDVLEDDFQFDVTVFSDAYLESSPVASKSKDQCHTITFQDDSDLLGLDRLVGMSDSKCVRLPSRSSGRSSPVSPVLSMCLAMSQDAEN